MVGIPAACVPGDTEGGWVAKAEDSARAYQAVAAQERVAAQEVEQRYPAHHCPPRHCHCQVTRSAALGMVQEVSLAMAVAQAASAPVDMAAARAADREDREANAVGMEEQAAV